MTDSRTPTPRIDSIWDRVGTTDRWHRLWVSHLEAYYEWRGELKPGSPQYGETLDYTRAADQYLMNPTDWNSLIDEEERKTRHDLVAALNVFNRQAGHYSIHRGLTSHDIVDVTRQYQIIDSLNHLVGQGVKLACLLARQAEQWRDLQIVGRTHGQPAQATTYGHRIAAIAWPLCQWLARAHQARGGILIRPTGGAVGTGADLARVLGPNRRRGQYDEMVHERPTAPITRQTYHRSVDLHVAAVLAELGSIAATWANDRRLEAMLGLGNEMREEDQVGSSAMGHKTNPVLCERIVSLATMVNGFLGIAAQGASLEWLEGDVSGSAARRAWLWEAFQTADRIIANWQAAILRWRVDLEAVAGELRCHQAQLLSGAALEWLIQVGVRRDHAHAFIRAAPMAVDGQGLAAHLADAISTSDLYHDKVDPDALRRAYPSWRYELAVAGVQVDEVVHRIRRLLDV